MGTRFIAALACAACVGLLAGGASAATYDEAIDGDLSDSNAAAAATPIGVLSLGSNLITASLTGDPQDDADNFSFVVASDTALSAIIWTYDMGSFSSSGNFYLKDETGSTVEAFNYNFGSSGGNFLGAAAGPGNYRFDIRAVGDTVGLESYSLDLQVVSTALAPVPLPATGWLALGGLAALGLTARRRQRGVAS